MQLNYSNLMTSSLALGYCDWRFHSLWCFIDQMMMKNFQGHISDLSDFRCEIITDLL